MNKKIDGNKIGIFIIVSMIVSISIWFCTYLDNKVIDYVSRFTSIIPLIDLILLIYGRVKYPKNKLLDVIMRVFIITFVLGLIGFIILICLVGSALVNCGLR